MADGQQTRQQAREALSSLPEGAQGELGKLELDPEEGAWLRALGLFEGQRVTVLRYAPFGGPVHVRTASGGDFALDRALAQRLLLRPGPVALSAP